MQISVQHDKYQGHRRSPWLVVVPRRISSTGKRQYRRFPSRAGATAFASQLKAHVKAHGERPVDTLTGEAASEARQASAILAGSGLSLGQAAAFVAELLRIHGSVANALQAGGKGRGEATAPAAAEDHAPAAAPQPAATPAAVTLGETIGAMQRAKSYQASATIANRATRFRTLLRRNPRLAAAPLSSLTPALLEQALNRAWPSAPAAWNDCHKHLSALYAYAMRKGLCGSTPMAAIDLRHDAREEEITPLRPAELRALFAACRPPSDEERAAAASLNAYERRCTLQDCTPLRPYIALCALAGVRPAECARLRWQDISLEESVVTIRSRQAKTGGARHIELCPALAAWLTASRPPNAAPSDPITPPCDLKWKLRCLRRRAGYGPGRPWQDDVLRHSYATYYLLAGGELPRLMLNMGHSNTRLLYTRYTNMAGATRAMAAEWWQTTPESMPCPHPSPP